MENNVIYAKSEENGAATLLDHSVECAKNCLKLAEYAIKEGIRDRELLIDMCVFAGMFHDLGKCSDDFQRRVRGEEVKCKCVHNIASMEFLTKYLSITVNDSKDINDDLTKVIYSSIVNHHPVPDDNSAYFLKEYNKSLVSDVINKLVGEYKNIRNKSKIDIHIKEIPNGQTSDTTYYRAGKKDDKGSQGDNNLYNKYLFIVSNILKYADIVASSSSNVKLLPYDNIFNNINIIERKPSNYDCRFDIQYEFSKKLSKYNISCFNSQTGFGKTMLGIMYIIANGKRGYWICPRNTIAKSIYASVDKEIKALGLENTISIALLLSNEYKKGNMNADIIITNIDNYMRPEFKTDSNIRTFDMLNSTCIFDEFHEYLTDDAILAAYDVSMRARKIVNSHTLLLSATPIKELYMDYIDSEDSYIKYDCEKILLRKKRIMFGLNHIPSNVKDMNYFICTNSVSRCQDIYWDDKVNNIIHARYTDDDKDKKFDLLYKTHDENAYDCKEGHKLDNSSWSGTKVVSTGCDISFDNTVFYHITPELLLQGLGRNDRWGRLSDNNCIPNVIITFDKSDCSERGAVKNIYSYKIVQLFYEFLCKEFKDDSIITLNDLYNARDKFYNDEKIKSEFSLYFGGIIEESYKKLSKINYSYSRVNDSDNKSGAKYIQKQSNLRSDELSNKNKYWIITYDKDTLEPTMNGVMQYDIDDIEIYDLICNYRTTIKKIFEKYNLFDKYGFKKDVFDKKEKEYCGKRHGIEFEKKLMEKFKKTSLCSETPMIVANLFSYNDNIGLYENI